MRDIWFISDTHFCHANILKFTDDNGVRIRKEFQSLDEMDGTMIERWNSRVKDGDSVYHLGDVTFRYDGRFQSIMSQLKGRKRLVVGNHDKLKNPNLLNWFEKIFFWRPFKEFNFICTHVPLRDDQMRHAEYNLHGHIHQNKSPTPRHICCCVEQTDYYPIHLDEVVAIIKERSCIS